MHQRLGQGLEERGHRLRGVLLRADVAPDDAADLAQVDLLGERRPRRHGVEGEEAVQLARRSREKLAVDREHLGAGLDRPERRPADDRAHLVQPEEERGDDAEVAAAAPDRPVQIGVLVGARAHALAACQHELRLEQVVDREPALAGQVADAAAEGEAADPGGRDDPARRREPVLVRRPIDFAPGAAAADPDGAGLRIDLDVLQRREVDDDAVVARSQAGAVVAAAADGQEQVVVACERDGHGDVVRTRALRDQRRPLVDHRVVDLARLVVVGVLGPDQPSLEAGELLARGACGCRDGAHAVLLCRTTSSWIRNNSAPFVDGAATAP